ncbi:MAG: TFIIB-type zinc ribbon-containing protein [Promethearchaeota archaeon]
MTIKNAKFKKKKMKCPNCGTRNSFLVSSDLVNTENYCSSCGSVIDTRREIWNYQCIDCKYKFDKSEGIRRKCPKCGSKRIKYTAKGREGRILGDILDILDI